MSPHPPRKVPDEKTCGLCGEVKAAKEFRPNPRMKSGLDTYCRPCAVAKSRAWREANPDRVKALQSSRKPRTTEERWAIMLWVNYRIKPDDYWELHKQQSGLCAICDRPNQTKRGLLHVDHCHKSGRVRGLLCNGCNLALGHMQDRIDLLRRAIHYLEAN